MTNGDKIRQMSDEDMLEFFFGSEAFTIMMMVPEQTVIGNVTMVRETAVRFLDWMKEECKET